MAPKKKTIAARPNQFGIVPANQIPNYLPDSVAESVVAPNINREFIVAFDNDLKWLLAEDFFSGIQLEPPLGLDRGATLRAFDQRDFETAMVTSGCFTCSCSLFIHDLRFLPTPGVQTSLRGIETLQKDKFATPPKMGFPFNITLAVEGTEIIDCYRGLLPRISPEEPVAALLKAIRAAFASGCDDTEKEGWKRVLLTIPTTFERITIKMDIFYRALNIREDMIKLAGAVKRSALAWILLIANYKMDQEKVHGKMGNQQLAALFNNHVSTAEETEAVTQNTVDNAMYAWNNCLTDPRNLELLLECERRPPLQNPIDSILNLSKLIRAAKNPENTTWALAHLADACLAGLLSRSDITSRNIVKNGPTMGIVELFLMKKDLKDEYLNKLIFSLDIGIDTRNILIKTLADHATYRKNCGYPPGTPHAQVDVSWQRKQLKSKSSMATLNLIEAGIDP